MNRKFSIISRIAAVIAASVAALTAAAFAEERRVVAVGDLHGDYDAFVSIARDAGLINKKGKWSGGDTILVQLGDIPDRGPDTLKIINHLKSLERAATKRGGKVIVLIGNHEAMNMTDDLRYVTAEEYAAFKTRNSSRMRERYFFEHRADLKARYGEELDLEAVRTRFEKDAPLGYIEHRLAWRPQGEIGKWVMKHDAVLKIGDSVFVHGGISDAYVGRSPDEINGAVRAALSGEGPADILTDEAGPLWHRGNAAPETDEGAAEVARALDALGASRIVIGHTPSLDGPKFLYGGKVIVVDTGNSAAYGGVRSWLEIKDGEASAHIVGAAPERERAQ